MIDTDMDRTYAWDGRAWTCRDCAHRAELAGATEAARGDCRLTNAWSAIAVCCVPCERLWSGHTRLEAEDMAMSLLVHTKIEAAGTEPGSASQS